MQFIAHRINTIEQLKQVPSEWGVEVDLRDCGDRLVVAHDPFVSPPLLDFEVYLEHFCHKFIILNVKSERIEWRILELLKTHNIRNYFFLDCSFPMIYALSSAGETNIALRLSEFESIESILLNKSRASFVWCDSFEKFNLDSNKFNQLKNAGFKLCLVSPELQNRQSDIALYRQKLLESSITLDVVCAKMHNAKLWLG